MTSPFTRQTTVDAVPGSPGHYRAELTDQWSAPVLPQGGIVTAIGVRAMETELASPAESLRSVTTVFAAQVHPGPVEVAVSVLRRGRTMSQLTATVRNVGEPAGHTSLAVFGATRVGFEFSDLVAPIVPSPSECASFRDAPPSGIVGARPFRSTFWEQVEARPALGHPPWETWEPTSSERASWYRFDDPPTGPDGTLDPLALVSLCDTMPGSVGERMGGRQPVWLGPSADLTVHLFRRARSRWLLGHNRARFAGDGYASLEMALWDPEVGLVAYGTQMMFFSFPDGPPPPERRRPVT